PTCPTICSGPYRERRRPRSCWAAPASTGSRRPTSRKRTRRRPSTRRPEYLSRSDARQRPLIHSALASSLEASVSARNGAVFPEGRGGEGFKERSCCSSLSPIGGEGRVRGQIYRADR